ncbi:cell division protein ZapA [Clostridium felsineum]|uniref:Cell division protein ZapA n=1 Tax=Clostridium felsineum TaxID=36839 RepID=A0A1S8LPT0_9CLOT|nr:cell division protein ZapA [Clostridium felsineum]MCR3759837.1 cell division protein ZapA [Clostridium felsineum]URZ07236.1 Cell division protein ZapA [Clostridium felsineum]URZ12265.1 Cell division protein ZapA [Clostridium felsineum]URZ16934.1 Cell division protein ZapA [Clostridium felsineum DSM 794]
MNIITITINGMEYNLKGEEKEEYLRTVGNYVDKKIKNILGNNERLSTSDAAILTALNVTDDMFKLSNENERLADSMELMEKKIAALEEIQRKLESEMENVNSRNEELLKNIEEAKNNVSSEEVSHLVEQINVLKLENIKIKDESKSHIDSEEKYKKENKALRFNIHTLKYKIIDLENKFLENQISLAKAKKEVVEVLNNNPKSKNVK